jgi:molybdopterin converting factor small subunit
MAVRFLIPGPLQPFSGGLRSVAVDGSPATVREALDALGARHPGVRDRVITEVGEIRPHVNLFVGEENVRDARGLDTAVPADGEIAILPAVSGG